MKDYLVDVPVQTNIWVRPEMQRRQFEVLKEARPSTLIVISDGGRNEKEWEIINKHREMFDTEIDWNCNVIKFYSDKNLGMYGCMMKRHETIWSHVDRCILLEDDIIPSISFFRYCAELLEKYKDDPRIYMICGMNHEGITENVNSDYFFSRYGSIWGYALWKRSYEEFFDFAFKDDPYALDLVEKRARSGIKGHERQFENVARYGKYDGHIPGDEFYMNYANYAQNQLLIIPKKNMITCIGCEPGSAHSTSYENLPKGIRRVFNMERYEIEFPLKHAKYVMPDAGYEKRRNRIMAFGHPIVQAYRNAEAVYLNIKNGNGQYVTKTIKKRFAALTGKHREK
ncbi:MAG: hypothetical protein K6D03_00025 [Solobacterium sp.]|nr:hypothetical protein [Solobacterium sp.]